MCVCVCVCLPASRSNPEGRELCWVVSFFNGSLGASSPRCSCLTPWEKKKKIGGKGESEHSTEGTCQLLSHNLKLHILTCLLWFRPAVRPWRLFWLISVSCISSSCAPAPTCRQQPGCSSSPPGYQEEDLGQCVPPPPIALLSLTPPCSSSVLSASILPSRVPLPCLSLSDLWVTNIRHSTSPLFVLCLSFFLFCFLIYSLHQFPCSRWVFSWCSISVVVITGGEA